VLQGIHCCQLRHCCSSTQQQKSVSAAKPPSLFGASDDLFGGDDQDDFFMPKPAAKKEPEKPKNVKQRTKASKQPDLFGDGGEDDDLFAEPSSAKPKASKPKDSLFGSPDSEDSTPSSVPEPKKPTSQRPVASKSKQNVPSLFGSPEEEPDDLFSGPPAAPKDTPKPAQPSKSAAPKPPSVFSDEDEDIFGSKSSSAAVKKEPLKVTPGGGLSSDEEDDLFGSGQKASRAESTKSIVSEDKDIEDAPKPKKPVGGVSMFGGIDPLAARKNLKSGKSPGGSGSTTAPAPKPKASPGIFGNDKTAGDSSDDNDIFSTKKSKPAGAKPKSSPMPEKKSRYS